MSNNSEYSEQTLIQYKVRCWSFKHRFQLLISSHLKQLVLKINIQLDLKGANGFWIHQYPILRSSSFGKQNSKHSTKADNTKADKCFPSTFLNYLISSSSHSLLMVVTKLGNTSKHLDTLFSIFPILKTVQSCSLRYFGKLHYSALFI